MGRRGPTVVAVPVRDADGDTGDRVGLVRGGADREPRNGNCGNDNYNCHGNGTSKINSL